MAFDTLVDRTQLENGLKATADAIRAKTGSTDKIEWNTDRGFADVVSALTAEESIKHADVPDYVKSEALRVANLVESVRKDDSIVFLAMSDSHHCGEQSDTGWQTNTNIGNLHAVQAAKILSYVLDMDFACHLGDLTFGHGTTTSELLHHQLEEMTNWLDESQKGIPTFMSLGNHDTGMYAVNGGTETEFESIEYLFSIFGARCEGATYGSTEHGYCYRDFDSKKLRVICLNSSERDSLYGYGTDPAMSDTQLLWFAQALHGVGSKSGWSVLVLSHYPLDFATCYKSSSVVKAYVEGSSITLNGTTVNFSGANNAKFVANFHGHTHCFKYARLNEVDGTAKTATEYDAWRIATPNSGFYRNNHQTTDKHGISFQDDKTYDKTIGGAKDTSFVVNVINPSDEVVHSFVYGAGIDRVVGYGTAVYYRISKDLSGVEIDNMLVSAVEGSEYIATLTPEEHHSITSVTITMGGNNVTSTVYSDGVISIPEVTGDIVITAKATAEYASKNWIPVSTDSTGAIYNGVGYKNGVYLSSGDGIAESKNDAISSTGYIPVKIGDIIRMDNMAFAKDDNAAYHRLMFYNANKEFTGFVNANNTWYLQTRGGGTLDANNCWNNITLTTEGTIVTNDLAYIRISASNITERSVLTVNEEILYADEVWNINNNFVNVTCSNVLSYIKKGEPYEAKITVPSGYEIKEMIIDMGDNDISNTYSNGMISIPTVTADLFISIVAEEVVLSYTNQLPISIDTSGNVYNGKGYKENTYISGGNDGTKTGSYTSGFIPCPKSSTGYSTVFYFKNVGMQTGQDAHRFSVYYGDKTYKNLYKTTNIGSMAVYGNDGNIEKISLPAAQIPDGGGFIRFCCSYIGEDSVVTVNEQIE